MNTGPATADFATPESLETLDYLMSAIEHAPKSTGHIADDLRGWWTADGWYVCSVCASRIIARGCRLPKDSVPVWASRPEPYGECCCCK